MGWRFDIKLNQIYERRKRSNEPEEERVASKKKTQDKN
jgi:hypothetical protein